METVQSKIPPPITPEISTRSQRQADVVGTPYKLIAVTNAMPEARGSIQDLDAFFYDIRSEM